MSELGVLSVITDDRQLEQPTQTSLASDHLPAATSRSSHKKWVLTAVFIATAVTLCSVAQTQFSHNALNVNRDAFNAPFFLTWFNTIWMIIVFPAYLCGWRIWQMLRPRTTVPVHGQSVSNAISIREHCRLCAEVFGANGLSVRAFIFKTLPFTSIWIFANYFYSQALVHISATETMSLFSSNIAFVYALSWILLDEHFVLLRLVGITVSIAGVVIVAVGEGVGSYTFIGSLFAVLSAVSSAMYKALFKKIVGNATLGQVSLFLSMLGICNFLVFLPIPVALILAGVETVKWPIAPWGFVCGSALLSLGFNFFLNLGVALTEPIVVSIGIFFGTPATAVVDAIFNNQYLNLLESIGSALILFSFVLILLPEKLCANRPWTRCCRGQS